MIRNWTLFAGSEWQRNMDGAYSGSLAGVGLVFSVADTKPFTEFIRACE
jgi:hypothetical protein